MISQEDVQNVAYACEQWTYWRFITGMVTTTIITYISPSFTDIATILFTAQRC